MKQGVFLIGIIPCLLACSTTDDPQSAAYKEQARQCYDESNQQKVSTQVPGGAKPGGVIKVDIPLGNNPYLYADCMSRNGYQVVLPEVPVKKGGHVVPGAVDKDGQNFHWSGGQP
ncbi:hypothetical protein KFZ76_12850 [Methylovulum psychrotolerans]|uniref:hypothetical protein n=1 Tax=Methylovulum psychrotolerans TaxID=1704499 RepID=UPI001BFF7EFE|nr:hypothetical protein [Methylovulum psychrotolerans]MBT9098589.1 hypothetical protein [Methylovulum psychrotolerans]